MAASVGVTAHGLTAAQKRMQERVRRMRDLTPVMRQGAALITKLTDDAFDKSRSPSGDAWPDIKEATKLSRGPKSSRKKTKAAQRMRDKLLAPGGSKPLVNTARARNSQRAKGTRKEIKWSAVGYLGPHITGSLKTTGRPPKRNPSVFEGKPGSFRLIASVRKAITASIARYVETGRP